jgi:hypothetical protein
MSCSTYRYFYEFIQDKEKDPLAKIPNFDYTISHSKK